MQHAFSVSGDVDVENGTVLSSRVCDPLRDPDRR